MTKGRDVEEALRRAGRVGEDLLAVDWSSHALGPPSGWPASLANAVRIVVTSRFSMWMAWGPELTFFCNDAYRRDTLGAKYPWALGRRADEVWEEIWPDIGPRIDRVVDTGAATWDEDLLLFLERSGYPEETYHTFSYSPLTGDDGGIAGMLCVVSEETERVVGDRRMRTLRDLGTPTDVALDDAAVFAAARPALAANPQCLPFTLAYLFTDDAGSARLVSSTGIEAGHPAAPAVIPAGDGTTWPAARAARGEETVVEHLGDRFGVLPQGIWPDPPERAAVVPLGRPGREAAAGFLVVGLNRYRPLDEGYLGFLRLVAGHLGTGVASARAYDAERRRAEALAALDRDKTTFFTNVSHEFRTPLTLLLGPVEDALADVEEPLPPAQRRRVDVMRRNASRMLKLVNMLLDFSRLESGRVAARYRTVDLAAVTRDLASMFRPAFERAGLSLSVRALPGDVVVHADQEMWAKIVLNLLSNALKHTFTGGVEVVVEPAVDEVLLRVRDTGVGIDEAEQGRLFERFHRVVGARTRSHEGSGIGLALVAELAQLHGGRVSVTSVPGQGSEFVVAVARGTAHLPPDQVDVAPAGSRPVRTADRELAGFLAEVERWSDGEDVVPLSVAGPADAPRVLVVDDNADMRAYLVSLLAGSYAVDVAADGVAALEVVARRRPDLVVSDVMMPGLDGFGLLAKLRGDERTADIPVILLSARAGEEATVEGLDAGADDYLVKPFSARELRARVRSNLELDRSRRTAVELERSRVLLDQAQRLSAVGSWETDLDGGRQRVSEELARQAGLTVDQLGSMSVEESVRRFVHPDDAGLLRAALDEARAGRPFDVQVRYVRDDGPVRWHRVIGEPTRDATGRVVGLRGSSQDVTDQVRTVELQAAAAAAREAAGREHLIAEELQLSLLPRQWFTPEHLTIATYYRAGVEGTHIGGDWYDVIELGAGRAALVVGDVMGRGVPAAAVMAQLRAAVRAFARLDLPPADVLELLDGVVRDLGDDQIVTCLYAVYDPGERILTYSNAGHLPPLLVRPGAGAVRLVDAGGPPLGAGPLTLTEQTVHVQDGAVLALYTDGLVERRDSDIDAGIDAFRTALTESMPVPDPDALVDRMLPDGPDDDVALLLAVASPGPAVSWGTSWTVGTDEPSAVAAARRRARAAMQAWRTPAGAVDDVLLVVSELVTNAIVHGRPVVEVRLRQETAHVVVEVHDAASFLPRKQRPSPDDEHGRGLQIVSRLAQRWGTRPTRGGKAVWCTVTTGRPEPRAGG